MRSDQLSYPAACRQRPHGDLGDKGAPTENRTLDLLLTMETLCRLSYRGNRKILYLTIPRNAKSGNLEK